MPSSTQHSFATDTSDTSTLTKHYKTHLLSKFGATGLGVGISVSTDCLRTLLLHVPSQKMLALRQLYVTLDLTRVSVQLTTLALNMQ